ncbi:LacI family DNA-binding transcriptional regulator [Caenibius sp. WL]|uniref:LacI family DNA-binding transcriptional regulator n=1 Tax=Caenibius sp. WL TaxID=2872646 RepID=UPI001C9900C5|nr:LacI family DNA-binding transcriptional regulator [Caenibius sp. WL]QZP07679.1 LacI family transcriptional regulator [Caenibius sp. WL]
MITIADVARAAGVSTATVSRTLSNPNAVSERRRNAVLQAVEALGYSPNFAAKNLRTTRSQRIILTVPDISNPFYSAVIRGAEEAAQTAGYSILIGDTRHDSEREEYYAKMLARREADGMIFLGHRLSPTAARIVAKQGAQAPVVNGCEYEPALNVSSVHIANAVAAAEAMQHLYNLGHRRIGVITGPLHSPLSRDRLNGVQGAAMGRGLLQDIVVRTGDFSLSSGEALTRSLLDETPQPTAIFCFSDEMAFGAIVALRERGLSCPGDVSVVGFDDIRLAGAYYPALTTIRQPKEMIGQKTVEIMLDILSNDKQHSTAITLPHELIVRESTRLAAA